MTDLEKRQPEPEEVEKPNFEPSGLLARFSNSVNGVALKYSEPLEAHVPVDKWRCYMLKDEESVVHCLGNRSYFMFGKDDRCCSIILEHPTCSKQHAVVQFKLHSESGNILPYLIDLESTNGTLLNGKPLDSARYVQLIHKDVVKFGQSRREYVFIKE